MDVTREARQLLDKLKAPEPVTGAGANLMPLSTRIEVNSEHGPIGAWRAGTGPAILFVHGWEDTHRTWRRFVQTCLADNLAIVLMDLPGHGISAKSPYTTHPFAADAIMQVAEQAGPFWSVVAHSFGCVATSSALQRGLSVEAAAFIAPPVPGEDNDWIVRQRKKGVDEAVLAAAREVYRAKTGHGLEPFDMADALRTWGGDVFIAASEADEKTPIAPIRTLADKVANITLHDAFTSDHRELTSDGAVIAEVMRFLRGPVPA